MKTIHFGALIISFFVLVLLSMVSCKRESDLAKNISGNYLCEQYSHTWLAGHTTWDTLIPNVLVTIELGNDGRLYISQPFNDGPFYFQGKHGDILSYSTNVSLGTYGGYDISYYENSDSILLSTGPSPGHAGGGGTSWRGHKIQ
ncbi:MAG: hypothetical protein U0V74_13355 [Chitinophagales bacterium]